MVERADAQKGSSNSMPSETQRIRAILKKAISAEPKRRCCVCNDPGAPILRKIIREINSAAETEPRALKITMKQIYEAVEELAPGFHTRARFHSFRVHLYDHEPDYRRARSPGPAIELQVVSGRKRA
jgi:hypothetical protein